jgi:predicted outer membrane protein
MRRLAHRMGGTSAALLCGLLLMAGCGSDDGTTDDPTDTPSEAATADVSLADSCAGIEAALPAQELPRHADWTDAATAIDEVAEAGDADTKAALEKLQGTLEAYITYPEMTNGEFKQLSTAYQSEIEELTTQCADAGSPIFG